MTKRERIRAVVEGREPDKLPYSFWTHLPGIDLDPERLAEETYKFYRTYDVDFIKTMNNGMYAIEDFGCEIDYSEVLKGGVAHVVKTPIHQAEDWYKLSVCPVDKGSLARELKSLALLLEKTKQEDVPVIFTVFSPITTANKLSGGTLRQYLADGHGEAVHHALKIIPETTCQVAKRAIELGADGIFFAAQSSTYDFMTAEEYEEYGVPYDMEVLEAAKDGWMNTIHAHGPNIMLELLKNYPVDVFNWHVPGDGKMPHGRLKPHRHHPVQPQRHPPSDFRVLQNDERPRADIDTGLRDTVSFRYKNAWFHQDDQGGNRAENDCIQPLICKFFAGHADKFGGGPVQIVSL